MSASSWPIPDIGVVEDLCISVAFIGTICPVLIVGKLLVSTHGCEANCWLECQADSG